jgi:hypothetical protein
MMLEKIIFVTGNANKLTEVQAIIGHLVQVENKKIDLDELQGTIDQISKDKCRRAAEIVRLLLHRKRIGELTIVYSYKAQCLSKILVSHSMLWVNFRDLICMDSSKLIIHHKMC